MTKLRESRWSGILHLHGPLADNPTAKILHALLLGLLVWHILHLGVFVPFFVIRKLTATALNGCLIVSYASALVLLSRGKLRSASLVYLGTVSVLATILVLLNGGIYSYCNALFVSIPISAAWLLGARAVVVSSGLCLLSWLAMALLETLGIRPPKYFPGTPLSAWAIYLQAIVITGVPVMVVLRRFNESLEMATRSIGELRHAKDALCRERELTTRIMETSPIGIFAMNGEGTITYANASFEVMLGLATGKGVGLSYNDLDWRHYDGSPVADDKERPFSQVRASRRAIYNVRLATTRRDGSNVLTSVNAAPLQDAAGQFDGMVAAMADMTERERVEKELQRHREDLEQLVHRRTEELVIARDQATAANQAKSLFLANMSHELRTPLTAILGLAASLGEHEGATARQREKFRIIERSGKHLLELVNGLLDMAKIEAGTAIVELDITDLNELVFEITGLMRARAEEKLLDLVLDESSFPRYVRTDGGKLRQILINLIGNAIKYTERGHVTVSLSIDTAGERPLLRLEVGDTGVGIAAEDQERIFDPFVRAGKPEAGGIGLGLAITRQYTQAMGGEISVESAPGMGSRFCVVLPVETVELPEAGKAVEQEDIRLAPVLPHYRVLVVENEEENWLVLKHLLTTAGLQVRRARNGAAAVEEFRSWRPHFIWMDWRLPVMDGKSATECIRAMEGGRDVKIAALTTSISPEERAGIMQAGVNVLIGTPFRPDDILNCMARHLYFRHATARRISPEALGAVPRQLREDLAAALVRLDVTRVNEIIGRISELDDVLGAALARHAERLGFTTILKAVQSSEGHTPEEAT